MWAVTGVSSHCGSKRSFLEKVFCRFLEDTLTKLVIEVVFTIVLLFDHKRCTIKKFIAFFKYIIGDWSVMSNSQLINEVK